MDANNAWQRAQRPAGWDGRRKASVWTCYRLRWPEYQAILARQNGQCAICQQPFKSSKVTHIDHAHGCDHPDKGVISCAACVRGILCVRCNSGLAILDDMERLKRAVAYLDREDVAEVLREFRLW